MSSDQNAGQTEEKSFENVINFKYFGTTLRNSIACMKESRADYIQGIPALIL
jgi:glutaredoxin-related protein